MKGKLTISRINSTDVKFDNMMTLEIDDVVSGTRFIEVLIAPEQFMLALSGLAYQECEFKLYTDNVGKIRELKTEEVKYIYGRNKQKALVKYNVDGWLGYEGDLGNHHRGVAGKPDMFTVTFTRFVDPK